MQILAFLSIVIHRYLSLSMGIHRYPSLSIVLVTVIVVIGRSFGASKVTWVDRHHHHNHHRRSHHRHHHHPSHHHHHQYPSPCRAKRQAAQAEAMKKRTFELEARVPIYMYR